MPHADSSLVPPEIKSKAEFWAHVLEQLTALIEGQRNWISNLANASALIYNSLLAFEQFGAESRAVNWCGFYLESQLFPISSPDADLLLLGPFCGKPACQFIRAEKGKGVCADAFVSREVVIVDDVNAYPGHIACDGDTNSEIVLPIIHRDHAIGVLDLDCLAISGFDEADRVGLQAIVILLAKACDWPKFSM
ncbi:GAF domain-like protein [Sistotremastrum niveocremeum HHB9708]|uniref:GAF domain-like protein n=2 Tax=Sistotremastraceae TaxID=3402574 RepID=A0A165A6F9_9AGAM|nr:GAF domain-like protein [Sistotremastrum niveocremeum HHB9708]KZT43531.1 GAF domain-like protein [Sistotremastrum suecicum HHB10207 ss-3]